MNIFRIKKMSWPWSEVPEETSGDDRQEMNTRETQPGVTLSTATSVTSSQTYMQQLQGPAQAVHTGFSILHASSTPPAQPQTPFNVPASLTGSSLEQVSLILPQPQPQLPITVPATVPGFSHQQTVFPSVYHPHSVPSSWECHGFSQQQHFPAVFPGFSQQQALLTSPQPQPITTVASVPQLLSYQLTPGLTGSGSPSSSYTSTHEQPPQPGHQDQFSIFDQPSLQGTLQPINLTTQTPKQQKTVTPSGLQGTNTQKFWHSPRLPYQSQNVQSQPQYGMPSTDLHRFRFTTETYTRPQQLGQSNIRHPVACQHQSVNPQNSGPQYQHSSAMLPHRTQSYYHGASGELYHKTTPVVPSNTGFPTAEANYHNTPELSQTSLNLYQDQESSGQHRYVHTGEHNPTSLVQPSRVLASRGSSLAGPAESHQTHQSSVSLQQGQQVFSRSSQPAVGAAGSLFCTCILSYDKKY